jgi:glycerol-3-phosphate cytidylyltransferase
MRGDLVLTVLTMGAFDLLHEGHLGLLEKCRHLADGGRVVVGVNSDNFIRSYKKRPPVLGEAQRIAVLSALRTVDEVTVNLGGPDHTRIFLEYQPDVFVTGTDWANKDHATQLGLPTMDWLADRGILPIYVHRTGDVSTTELRANL